MVLTLALGIGATAAIFSVVYGVLLKPLPFHEPERLVALYHRGRGVNLLVMNQGPATYFTYRDNHRAFEDIGAWDRQAVSITGRGEPERVQALAVTDGTLPLLRVQPVLGRLFSEEDDRPGSPVRVVLTYGYWQRKFGGAHDVIGQPLEIDGEPATVVGVLPASFKFPRADPALLLPMQLDRAEANWVSFGFQAVGRLKPGVTLSEANADVARMIPLVEQVPGYAALRLEPNVYRGRLDGNSRPRFREKVARAPRESDYVPVIRTSSQPASDRQDADKLDQAIRHLTRSLDPTLWGSLGRLHSKGGEKVFNELKDAVNKLGELQKNKKSSISSALQGLIDGIVKSARELAQTAINDAIAAGGSPKDIGRANEEISKGDIDFAAGKYESAVEHYRNGWNHVVKTKGSPQA